MRKNFKKYFVAIFMLITILPLTLTGCNFTKKAKNNGIFPKVDSPTLMQELAEFGSDYKIVKGVDSNKTNKITIDTKVVDAYAALQDNYQNKYDYFALKGMILGDSVGDIAKINQTVYTTQVKERKKDLSKDIYTIYHEDVAVADKFMFPMIEKVLQTTTDGENTYISKISTENIISNPDNKQYYPDDISAKYVRAEYKDKASYTKEHFNDFDNLLQYVVDATTVDEANSKIVEVGPIYEYDEAGKIALDENGDKIIKDKEPGLLELVIKFKPEALEKATNTRREVIALKSHESPKKTATAKDVEFHDLEVHIQVVKTTGYIRFINIHEDYTLTLDSSKQNCSFDSYFYASHKPSDLPLSLYEPFFNK